MAEIDPPQTHMLPAHMMISIDPDSVKIDEQGRIQTGALKISDAMLQAVPPQQLQKNFALGQAPAAADTNYGCGWNYRCAPQPK